MGPEEVGVRTKTAEDAMAVRRPAGPERPTPFERVVGLLRLPYPVAAFVFALVLSGPGFLLVEVARTMNWDEAVGIVLVRPTWEGIASAALFTVVDFLLFMGIHRMRMQVVAAKHDLIALGADEETYRRAFRWLVSAWPVVLAVGFEAISVPSILLGDPGRAEGPFIIPVEILRFLLTFGIFTFVWVYATGLKGLHDIGKRRLRLRPHWEDPLLGTRPIGQISLRFAAGYYVVLFLVIVANSLMPEESTPWTVAILAVIGVVMFFLPLTSVHRTMSEVKGNELSAIRSRISRLLATRHENRGTAEPLAQLDRHLQDFTSVRLLEMELREAGNIRTWPFDVRIIGQLTVILLSVAAALITRVLLIFLNL